MLQKVIYKISRNIQIFNHITNDTLTVEDQSYMNKREEGHEWEIIFLDCFSILFYIHQTETNSCLERRLLGVK